MILYEALKGINPYDYTWREYAVIVRKAAVERLPILEQEYLEAKARYNEWAENQPPCPKRPASFPSDAALERWKALDDEHSSKFYRALEESNSIAGNIDRLKQFIELADLIESGEAVELNRKDSNAFWMRFGGVNCPLLCHGQRVFLALYQGEQLRPEVLADYPETVADIIRRSEEAFGLRL